MTMVENVSVNDSRKDEMVKTNNGLIAATEEHLVFIVIFVVENPISNKDIVNLSFVAVNLVVSEVVIGYYLVTRVNFNERVLSAVEEDWAQQGWDLDVYEGLGKANCIKDDFPIIIENQIARIDKHRVVSSRERKHMIWVDGDEVDYKTIEGSNNVIFSNEGQTLITKLLI